MEIRLVSKDDWVLFLKVLKKSVNKGFFDDGFHLFYGVIMQGFYAFDYPFPINGSDLINSDESRCFLN